MKVKLEWYEMMFAAQVGIQRRMESIKSGRTPMFPYSPDEYWTRDIEGACGELAFAKSINHYWSGSINTFRLGDVGRIQVRTSIKQSSKIFIYEKSNDGDIYVHVTGSAPEYIIEGWIRAGDAKKREWFNSNARRPAYFVPKEFLRPIEELSVKG